MTPTTTPAPPPARYSSSMPAVDSPDSVISFLPQTCRKLNLTMVQTTMMLPTILTTTTTTLIRRHCYSSIPFLIVSIVLVVRTQLSCLGIVSSVART
jgi:hypothetical protein